MKMFRNKMTYFLLLVLVLLVGISIGAMKRLDYEGKKQQTIYLITKTSVGIDFWNSVAKGAKVAATELGVKVVVDGPKNETEVEKQIEIIENAIKKKPAAIAVAATDYERIGEVCQKAINQGITVVTYDSDALFEAEHSYVATNNLLASQRLAHELGTMVKREGRVVILSHVKGTYSAFEREEGFKKGLKPFENLVVEQTVYYSNDDLKTAYQYTKEIVKTYPDIVAIYGTNEVSLQGAAEAVNDLGIKDDVHVVGFDMNTRVAYFVETDVIKAAMAQRPFNMGYLAIKEALEVQETNDPRQVDVSAVLINKENMFLPENQKLIVPFAER